MKNITSLFYLRIAFFFLFLAKISDGFAVLDIDFSAQFVGCFTVPAVCFTVKIS